MMSGKMLVALCLVWSVTGFTVSPQLSSRRNSILLRRSAEETTIPREEADPSFPGVAAAVEDEFDDELSEKQREIARLRAAEKFIEKETGIYVCKVCSYKYDPEVGQPIGGIQPGTLFEDLPASWRCPTCRAQKDAFEPQTLTIAGFAENQGYGLGGNTMTEEGKSSLIFGALAAFFVLFMAGYLLN